MAVRVSMGPFQGLFKFLVTSSFKVTRPKRTKILLYKVAKF